MKIVAWVSGCNLSSVQDPRRSRIRTARRSDEPTAHIHLGLGTSIKNHFLEKKGQDDGAHTSILITHERFARVLGLRVINTPAAHPPLSYILPFTIVHAFPMSTEEKHDVEASGTATPNADSSQQAVSSDIKPQVPAGPTFPEGGMQAWSTVLGAYVPFSFFSAVLLLIFYPVSSYNSLLSGTITNINDKFQ